GEPAIEAQAEPAIDPVAHVRQAQALMQAGRAAEALVAARLGLSADPQNVDCRVLQGEALLALTDFAAAEDALRRSCEAFPDHVRLWELLATASWSLGRPDAALAAIDRAWARAPMAHLATHKGWMLLKRGEPARAETVLRDAIERFPERASACQLLTQVYKAWERWDDGAAAAERACAEDAGNFDMWESWAACLIAARRPREASAVIDDALP